MSTFNYVRVKQPLDPKIIDDEKIVDVVLPTN
jgi:hypothetical protein